MPDTQWIEVSKEHILGDKYDLRGNKYHHDNNEEQYLLSLELITRKAVSRDSAGKYLNYRTAYVEHKSVDQRASKVHCPDNVFHVAHGIALGYPHNSGIVHVRAGTERRGDHEYQRIKNDKAKSENNYRSEYRPNRVGDLLSL